MKKCSKCGIEKEESEFSPDKRNNDGLQSQCRECGNKRLRQYQAAHKGKLALYRAAYHMAHQTKHNQQRKQRHTSYHHTWRGYASCAWNGINARTINGRNPRWDNHQCVRYLKRGVELRMTRPEWMTWCESQKEIIERIYQEGDLPSVDRIDGKGHYELGNIQILSMRENCRKH